jgi:hypothetical protein
VESRILVSWDVMLYCLGFKDCGSFIFKGQGLKDLIRKTDCSSSRVVIHNPSDMASHLSGDLNALKQQYKLLKYCLPLSQSLVAR